MTLPGDVHVPIRTCIGCRRQHPQTRLVRCVLDADGSIRVDRRAPGRGAWLCGPECVEPARRKRAFDRAWRATVRPGAIEQLSARLAELND
jgi:hypothetical protein